VTKRVAFKKWTAFARRGNRGVAEKTEQTSAFNPFVSGLRRLRAKEWNLSGSRLELKRGGGKKRR